MEEVVQKDIVMVLEKLLDLFHCEGDIDSAQLNELSNHTIHNISIFQDEDSITIAIVIFSLSKIMYRQKTAINCTILVDMFKKAKSSLKQDDFIGYRKTLKRIIEIIGSIDDKMKMYIEEIIHKARISKGGMLFEHGISIAQTAEVLGISQWELMNYIGKTKIIDTYQDKSSIKKRIVIARELFK